VDVAKALRNVTNQPLSAQTVHRNLKAAGLKAVVKKKKPFLSKRHRKARMDFALAHQHWTVEDWKKVVWSDETKINRLESDGRKWVWKKAGEGLSDRLVQGTQKFGGGSVMVWGCMLWDGPGYACRIDGRMDGDLYIKILEEDLQESLTYYGKDSGDVIFQQDNDSKHTCKKAQTWFKTMISMFSCGQHSLQTSIPLNTCGIMSRGSWENMKLHLGGYWSCGRGWKRSGIRLRQRCVRI
jgi:hypothetical protein